MDDLSSFVNRVKSVLADADREPHWTSEDSDQYMSAFGSRRIEFEKLAHELIEQAIRPRLEALAAFFPNVASSKNDLVGTCSYRFGYCNRFPASTKVEFSIEHDARYEKIIVRFQASMMPVHVTPHRRCRPADRGGCGSSSG
jgi:hypothetical protein